jgi:hypothetical protein
MELYSFPIIYEKSTERVFMAYIQKIIGPDEKLAGIGRLHWIYLAQGLLLFSFSICLGMIAENILLYGMKIIPASFQTSTIITTLLAISDRLMPIAVFIGTVIFLLYLAKVISTEIGLTNRRVVFKQGLIFVKVREIDIEEIRGENLDMGYFGRILGYGYLNFDCRFIGDVRLPAMSRAEQFLKALHKMRATVQDSISVVTGDGRPVMLKTAGPNDAAPAEAIPEPPVRPQIAPPAQNASVNVDSEMIAHIVDQAIPQMVEKIAAEMAAQGLINQPPEPMEDIDAELVEEFDEASAKPAGGETAVH